jgi:hypothetical protein
VTLKEFTKDPVAVLDYSFDWSLWLKTDTIATATWTSNGLVQSSTSISGTITTIWLSGGIAGERYIVTCRITTAGGRTDERSIAINIQER